jgi:hypothetical protein
VPGRKLIVVAIALAGLVANATALAPTTLSTSDRLGDRRYVTSGSRAYVVGSEAGRFPTLPFRSTVAGVRLDGRLVDADVRETNRGLEVVARARGGGRHELIVERR